MYSNLLTPQLHPVPAAPGAITRLCALYRVVSEGLGRSLVAGARMIEQQDGYPPGKLTIGGLVVWGLCLGLMLAGANTVPVLRYFIHCLGILRLG